MEGLKDVPIEALTGLAWLIISAYVSSENYRKYSALTHYLVAIVTLGLMFLLSESSQDPDIPEYGMGMVIILVALGVASVISLIIAVTRSIGTTQRSSLINGSDKKTESKAGTKSKPSYKPEPAPPHTLHEALEEVYDFARKTIGSEARTESKPLHKPKPPPPPISAPNVIYGFYEKREPEPEPPYKPKPELSVKITPDITYGFHEKTEPAPEPEAEINPEPPLAPEPIPMESKASDEDSQLDSLLRELGIPATPNTAEERRKKK